IHHLYSPSPLPHQQPPSFPTRRSSDLQMPTGSFRMMRPSSAPAIIDISRAGATTLADVPMSIAKSTRIYESGESNPTPIASHQRSEEHTSELQSPYDLVCRLLLEKKKK